MFINNTPPVSSHSSSGASPGLPTTAPTSFQEAINGITAFQQSSASDPALSTLLSNVLLALNTLNTPKSSWDQEGCTALRMFEGVFINNMTTYTYTTATAENPLVSSLVTYLDSVPVPNLPSEQANDISTLNNVNFVFVSEGIYNSINGVPPSGNCYFGGLVINEDFVVSTPSDFQNALSTPATFQQLEEGFYSTALQSSGAKLMAVSVIFNSPVNFGTMQITSAEDRYSFANTFGACFNGRYQAPDLTTYNNMAALCGGATPFILSGKLNRIQELGELYMQGDSSNPRSSVFSSWTPYSQLTSEEQNAWQALTGLSPYIHG